MKLPRLFEGEVCCREQIASGEVVYLDRVLNGLQENTC